MARLNINNIQLNNANLETIYNSVHKFRNPQFMKGDGNADDVMALLDQPSTYFFKMFFYFSNPYADNELSSNLLGLEYGQSTADHNGWVANTALNYLYNNCEYTRFIYLSEFIKTLSDVNIQCPWYFQTITGLDTALERNELSQRDFKIDEERKKIVIKCLPDAIDNRIGRMLDLYRAAAYSQLLHKEIIPANLRKFDMGIFIYSPFILELASKDPKKGIYNQGREINTKNIANIPDAEFLDHYASTKYIELRNCEIDMNSSKGVFSEANNIEGKTNEYDITISFDTCYEQRYDMMMNETIGDFVIEDIYRGYRDTDIDVRLQNMYPGTDTIKNMYQSLNRNDNINQDTDTPNTQGETRWYDKPIDYIKDMMSVEYDDSYNDTYWYDESKHRAKDLGNLFLGIEGENSILRSLGYEYGKDDSIGTSIVDTIMNRVDTAGRGIIMGNLYGFSLTNDVRNLMNRVESGGIVFDAIGAAAQSAENAIINSQAGFSTDPKELRAGKSLYGNTEPPETSPVRGNLYEDSEPTPPTPQGGNIFDTGNRSEEQKASKRGWNVKK